MKRLTSRKCFLEVLQDKIINGLFQIIRIHPCGGSIIRVLRGPFWGDLMKY